jgi:HAD superfamily hydrolase (TIGR01509 family)
VLSRSMNLRAVAWDVDGTLVDSEPLHHEALVHGTRRWGVDLSDLPSQAFRGLHMEDVWAALRHRLPDDLTPADWHASILSHYIEHRARIAHIPGAVATIEALAARGIPQVCVSNSGRAVIAAHLDALGVARHMRFIVSLDDVSAGKPDPEPYRTACEGLDLPPASVLAVEDSVTGALSASRAGLPVAFVSLTEEAAPAGAAAIADLSAISDLFAG